MAAGTPESGTGITMSAGDAALARELAAELLAHLVDVAAEDLAVGTREVDVLEDAVVRAARARTGAATSTPRSSITTISPGSTSRSYAASTRSSAQVSDATTTASPTRPEHQRAEAAGIARGDDLRLGEEDERVRPAHLGQRVDDAPDQRRRRSTPRSGG